MSNFTADTGLQYWGSHMSFPELYAEEEDESSCGKTCLTFIGAGMTIVGEVCLNNIQCVNGQRIRNIHFFIFLKVLV